MDYIERIKKLKNEKKITNDRLSELSDNQLREVFEVLSDREYVKVTYNYGAISYRKVEDVWNAKKFQHLY